MGSFSLFGLNTATSLFITAGIAFAAMLIGLIIGVLSYIIITRAEQRRLKREEKQTDRLIPPIFYTDAMKDPLFQEDLQEILVKGTSFKPI